MPKISTLATVSGASHRLTMFHITVNEDGAFITTRRPILVKARLSGDN